MSTTRSIYRTFQSSDGRVKLATLSGIAVLAAALVLILAVLPAGADNPSSIAGVIPDTVNLGGQPNDCVAPEIQSAAGYELRIENPQDGATYAATVPGYPTAQVTLSVSADDKVLGFEFDSATLAAFDVVIKGGQKSTHYD